MLKIVMFNGQASSNPTKKDKLIYSPIALRLILKHWPDETLRLSDLGFNEREVKSHHLLVPEFASSNSIFSDKSRWQQCLAAVLRAFLDSLGHVHSSKLKTLDLRGIELTEMDFLKNYKGLFLDPILNKTKCQIFLDLNITYANDYLLWSEILPRVQGVVKVAKLSTIFRTGFDSTKLILDALDERVLTCLAAKHLEMINEEFSLLVGSLSRLSNLTDLDLSCGTLRLAAARSSEEQNKEVKSHF